MIEHEFEPGSIYNMDENSVSTVSNLSITVLASKGENQICIVLPGEKGQTTTAVCAFNNAVGHYIPPAVICKRKNKAERLMRDAPTGSIQLISDNGAIFDLVRLLCKINRRQFIKQDFSNLGQPYELLFHVQHHQKLA